MILALVSNSEGLRSLNAPNKFSHPDSSETVAVASVATFFYGKLRGWRGAPPLALCYGRDPLRYGNTQYKTAFAPIRYT